MARTNTAPRTKVPPEVAPKPPSTTSHEPTRPNREDKPQIKTGDTISESELRPPIAQFIVNLVLQIAAFAVTIAFGIFAVKSVHEAIEANNYANNALQIARTANRLTLLTLCLSSDSMAKNITSMCDPVLSSTRQIMPKIIDDLFPNPTGPTEGAGKGDGRSGVVIGIVIGVLLVVILIGLGGWAGARHHKRKRYLGDMTIESDIKSSMRGKSTFRRLFIDTRVISRRR